jgi:exodeoxyribonuclease-3
LKIATYNINGISGRLPRLLEWLGTAKPDVVCLQELHIHHDEFPIEAMRGAGYGAVWKGQKTCYNGVAILARDAMPILVRDALPGDGHDAQARYIEAAVEGIVIACLYAPNGNPQPGPKFDYKLAWHERLNSHARTLHAFGAPVLLAGDFNIVPTPADIYSTHSYDDNALVQPQSRAMFRQLIGDGWSDAIRHLHPAEQIYTFWDYMRKRWQRNAGLRIDHLLLNPGLQTRLVDADVDAHVRAMPGASDHAPAWIQLAKTGRTVTPGRRRGAS